VLEADAKSGKDLTVVTKAGIANGKKQLDMAIKLDGKGNIADMAVDYCAPEEYLASISLFVISRELLLHYVRECMARNQFRFERDFVLRHFLNGKLSVQEN
jgi:ADP-glucose pyrophosphorylase